MTDRSGWTTTSAGPIRPICCQLATCSLGQEKKIVFLEAKSKVGCALESAPVRTNINSFFLKEKALNSSTEMEAKKRSRHRECVVRIRYPRVSLGQWLLPERTGPWAVVFKDGQFSSAQSLSRVRLFATPWTAARQASLSITNSWSLPKLVSIKSVMPSNYLILCCPLLLLPSIFPSITVFSNESRMLSVLQKQHSSAHNRPCVLAGQLTPSTRSLLLFWVRSLLFPSDISQHSLSTEQFYSSSEVVFWYLSVSHPGGYRWIISISLNMI